MPLLHDEDLVRPSYMPGRHLDPSIGLRARRSYIVSRIPFEQLLGGKTSDPILAADEENL